MKTMKYFSASWCGPCKAFKPVMTELKNEGHQIEFIDIDSLSDLAQQYNIKSVPTVVIEQAGREVDRFVGVIPKQQVLQKLL
jgi:thioredoxin 1